MEKTQKREHENAVLSAQELLIYNGREACDSQEDVRGRTIGLIIIALLVIVILLLVFLLLDRVAPP